VFDDVKTIYLSLINHELMFYGRFFMSILVEFTGEENEYMVSEMMFRQVFYALPQAIFILDLNGTILECNQAAQNFFSGGEQEVFFAQLTEWLNGSGFRQETWQGRQLRLELRILSEQMRVLEIYDESQNHSREVLFEESRTQSSRLMQMFESLPFGVAVLDLQTQRIWVANQRFCALVDNALEAGAVLNHIALRFQQVNTLHEYANGFADGVMRQALLKQQPIQIMALRLTNKQEHEYATLLLLDERLGQPVTLDHSSLLGKLRQQTPVVSSDFVQNFGNLYSTRPSLLEGRLVAMLLLAEKPISLTQATKSLEVSKVSISKLVNAMLERGDLTVSREFSTREHKFQLTHRLYLRDLIERRKTSSMIALQIDQLLEQTNQFDHKIRQQLHTHRELHLHVYAILDDLLAPFEKEQRLVYQQHLNSSWDAVLPLSATAISS
jgi:PAS domain-containing protein/DNA-binding transcriptional regulator GbsR (MarR family)